MWLVIWVRVWESEGEGVAIYCKWHLRNWIHRLRIEVGSAPSGVAFRGGTGGFYARGRGIGLFGMGWRILFVCFWELCFWRLVMGEETVKATHARYACER